MLPEVVDFDVLLPELAEVPPVEEDLVSFCAYCFLMSALFTLGCTRLQAFRKVVLPLALPGIAASGVFAFVTSWNEVFAAAVLTIQNRTLTAFLLQSLDYSPLPLRFAGGAVLVLPGLMRSRVRIDATLSRVIN